MQALQDHAEGRIEMDATQIRAADILLRKLLPNAPAARKAESELTPFSVRITEPKV